MNKIKLRLSGGGYEVRVGLGLLEKTGYQLQQHGFGGKLVIITNPVVKGLYGDALEQSLVKVGFEVAILEVPDGEEYKTLETAGRLYNQLTELYAERSAPILALGGGVIGDLAGFVAATYLRGVPLVQIPTTLLAQVDSSIGGKVAVDHGQLKNRIGTFYQPLLVMTDIGTLKTLPPEVFTSGLAEVIKSAVIWDKGLFALLEVNRSMMKSLDEGMLEEIVSCTARIKAEIVEKDEKDSGLRSILNYGHTVGHAIETVSDFTVTHGEAVAMGMMAAARISNSLGYLGESELARLETVIREAGLPTEISDLNINDIVQAIEHDKKVLEGKVRFILLKTIGKAFITDEVGPDLLRQVLGGSGE